MSRKRPPPIEISEHVSKKHKAPHSGEEGKEEEPGTPPFESEFGELFAGKGFE